MRKFLNFGADKRMPEEKRIEEEVALLRASPLLDPVWYRETYPDLRDTPIDVARHYLLNGAKEGRNPGPNFDTKAYQKIYPSVQLGGENPLIHFIRTLRNPQFAQPPAPKPTHNVDQVDSVDDYFSYSSRSDCSAISYSPAAELYKPLPLIAFYLPQFHIIPENNKWWGEGFTEWTNVTRAVPQFQGHYQPHFPRDLGYYDLTQVNVQHKQAHIAKSYGVSAFCFYFYWFSGQTLLEAPLEQFANFVDFPFCVCWANENWSRRWDGLDNDILMYQDYTQMNDEAFIVYISKYLLNKNYFKIDGKPLLIIYRPNLFPAFKETAGRWRNWCRLNGIGELHIACTLSFENIDAEFYGLDSVIEFPPNNTHPPQWSKPLQFLNKDFSGSIYDWTIFPERSRDYAKTSEKLHRGVCLPWDNESRKPGNGTIFIGATPAGYLEWLENACNDTISRVKNPSGRAIFINAWNEWAEGAHLEPDQKYGFAYLEATRIALTRVEAKRSENGRLPDLTGPELAIVIHAFYPDVFDIILTRINLLCRNVKLFVSSPEESYDSVNRLLTHSKHEYRLIKCENRGRDVAPFLKILPLVIGEKFKYIVKLHTKKSLHRSDGDMWRDELYDALLESNALTSTISDLNRNRHVGIAGPDNHVISMKNYLGLNVNQVGSLCARLGCGFVDLEKDVFVAGSMFIARTSAMIPLANLGIIVDDFELEAGQVDGTLAHAVERAFTYSAKAAGLRVSSYTYLSSAEDDFARIINEPNYPYAEKTVPTK